MPRALWKGSITFGLVYVPVSLYPASQNDDLDFDWLDKRDMSPVGYKRVNKSTGKEVTRENIVKGLAYKEGRYAILTEDEIRAAHPKATQTVELLSFVDADEIDPEYIERPYFLVPAPKGEKVYTLLRETLRKERKVGIANVVIATRQHLAALVPRERALVLLLLRWKDEVRDAGDLALPPAGKGGLKPTEFNMATQLVKSMSGKWKPAEYRDTFRDDIMKLVKKKVAAGKTAEILQIEESGEAQPTAKILDLTELLQKSLRQGGAGKSAKSVKPDGARTSAKVTPLKRKPATRKTSTTKPATPRRKRAAHG